MALEDEARKVSSAPAGAAAEQRLAHLVRLSPDAILVHRDDRIEFANQAAVELFGVASPQELLGRSPLCWFHPDDHAEIRERIRQVLSGEAHLPRNLLTVVRGDGTTRRAEGVAAAFDDERGRALQVILRDVTERERGQGELRAAHQRLTDILESITDAFYAMDGEWRLTYVNARAEATWRKGRQDLLGRKLWDVFPGYEATAGAAALGRAMRERVPVHLETHSPFLDRWVELFIYPAADGGLSVFFQDISERKAVQAAARESEQRAVARAAELQAVLDTVPAAVWIARDLRGTRIDTNRFGAELLRCPLGSNISTTGPEDERPTNFRLVRAGREIPADERPVQAAARRGEASRGVELDVVYDDGSTRHLLGNATPLLDATGARVGAVGAFVDITERRQFEARLRLVAEALPQLVWTADAAGRIDFFNQRWRDHTGQAAGQEAWEPALHPDDREEVVALWRAAVARQADQALEHRLRGADGQYRWFLRRASLLRDVESGYSRWFGTCTDIHDLKVSQELLRQADRLKEDFLNMAAHEFRTPLTALRLQLELLQRNLRGEAPALDRARAQLVQVDRQVDRLQVLLASLLDVSRLNAGRLTLDLAEVDLAAVAQEVVARLRPQAEAGGVEVRLRAAPAAGWWDPVRLDQVLTNLLGNAIKYGNRRPVEVEVAWRDGAAHLSVRDHGIGIAPEHQAAVFGAFERASNAQPFGGLGLGLWIVRKLVEAHGGEIRLESAVGQGSTFAVALPPGAAPRR